MAVYTNVSDAALAPFIDRYDIGRLISAKGIAEGVENSNFLVQTDRAFFILTLYERRVKEEDLPFFISLMDHLADQGICCPRPIRDREGRVLQQLSGRPATIVTFLSGASAKQPDVAHCAAVGYALAQLHEAGKDFPLKRNNALSLKAWRPLFEQSKDKADYISPGLAQRIEDELDRLENTWPEDLPQGLIHADLFPNNVFFIDKQLSGVFDFYFACTDALAYDLAICLNAWCFERDGFFNLDKGRALIRAYEEVRPLTKEEKNALPVLGRGACLRFLLTRLYDWLHVMPGALVKPLDPLEYDRKLTFHRHAIAAADYGVSDE